jgi:S1-C subfamily serine protease
MSQFAPLARRSEVPDMDPKPYLNSVVALSATIPEKAFTAGTLGTEREGSATVIRDDGLVLTVGYLVTEAEEVWLTRQDGRVLAAHPIAIDAATGFALVQAMGDLGLPALNFGDASRSKVGASVALADGTGRFTKGEVVARQEFAGYWEYLLDEAIFVAPAHPSWGGAALIGEDGALLGIGSLRLQMSRGGDVTDINMAVPIDLLPPILDDMLARGAAARPPRPWLGAFAAEDNGRVIVMNVTDGGPAAKAGLKQGDIIADVRDGQVEGLADFYRKLWAVGPAGTEVPMRIVRSGRDSWLRVKSADRNSFLIKPQMQ